MTQQPPTMTRHRNWHQFVLHNGPTSWERQQEKNRKWPSSRNIGSASLESSRYPMPPENEHHPLHPVAPNPNWSIHRTWVRLTGYIPKVHSPPCVILPTRDKSLPKEFRFQFNFFYNVFKSNKCCDLRKIWKKYNIVDLKTIPLCCFSYECKVSDTWWLID